MHRLQCPPIWEVVDMAQFLDRLSLKLQSFFSITRCPKSMKLFLCSGATLVMVTYILSTPYLATQFDYEEGDIIKNDIYVFRDVYYEKAREFEKQKRDAYEKQRFIFDRNYLTFRETVEKIDTELSFLSSIKAQGGTVSLAKKKIPFLNNTKSITDVDIDNALKDQNLFKISEWAIKYATLIFDRYGILKDPLPQLDNFNKIGAEIRTINHNLENNESLIWGSDQFIHVKDLFRYRNYNRLQKLGVNFISVEYKLRESTKKIVIQRVLQHIYRNPYLQYNPSLTKKLKLQAQNKIKPKQHLLKKGLMVGREGDPVDQGTYQKIKILSEAYQRTNLNHIFGIFLVQISIVCAMAFYISRFSDLKLRELSSNVILFSLMILFILYSFSLSRMSFFQNSSWHLALFIPSGFLGIVGTVLLGTRVTFATNIYLAFFVYFVSGHQMESFVMSFVSGIAGIHTATYMEKRTQVLQGVLTIALTIGFIVVSTHLTNQVRYIDLADKLFIAFVNGIMCVSLSSSFLPFYEKMFNLPTKFHLLELADNNNQLLNKIAMEAPSTHTHTAMVAALSERAVKAIGGDALLTRVGCLYHDIGKTIEPTFFAENRHLDKKSERFKKLGPYKSAQVIINHVVDGVKIAVKNQLPRKVIAFIPEHHGTTTIQYFYHQALIEASGQKKKQVKKSDFQYPGPKPQSRETAVVMVADSVEAAARSMDNPNKDSLEDMIDKIIQNKMMEDQFDESGLMVGDLKIIKKVFVDVLLNAFHLRPKYPDMNETKKLENNQMLSLPKDITSAVYVQEIGSDHKILDPVD